jgi:broad specificity phosphatase PhoE
MALERIFLIRHGLSAANVDPRVYQTTPDHRIPLVNPENDQACLRAGRALAKFGIARSALCTWHSPYLRCVQTKRLVLAAAYGADYSDMFRRESFLLREQEFGDWDGLTNSEIAERDPERFARQARMTDTYGRFYFRYPHGESRADVAERVTLFIGKMHRSSFSDHVIFLHGVTERCFRMAWFNHPVEWLEAEPNPKNAHVRMISRGAGGGWQESMLENQ